jgi:Tol biopolymer transport system component
LSGKPVRLTAGALSAVDASIAEDGTIAFGQLGGDVHLWEFPLTAGGEVKARVKLTNGPDVDSTPSVSRDGRRVVFARKVKQRHEIWMKDVSSGVESKIAAPRTENIHPVFSLSGEEIAFEANNEESKAIYVVRPGAEPKLVCTGCEYPTGWILGNRAQNQAILFTNSATGQIQKVSVSDGTIATVLGKDGVKLGDATWSPVTDYLLFTVAGKRGERQIFATKLPVSGAATGEWIPVTSAKEWSDNPQWSVDGGTIYFLSNRDNFTCVWGQKFNVKEHRGVGAPFAAVHFHDPHANPGLLVRSDFGLSVSKDSIVLDSGDASETIWRGLLKKPAFWGF